MWRSNSAVPGRSGPQVGGDARLQSDVLEDLSDAVNYRRWVCDLAAPWLGDDSLEVGSGHGDYAAVWLAGVRRLTVTEADDDRVAVLRRRFAGHPDVVVRRLVAPSTETARHSSVVAINVLEHIPDDVEALRGFSRLVRPGGRVVVFVPAHPFAFSRFDAAVGHVRRYTRQGLRKALEEAGLVVESLHPVNAPGLLAWVVWMRLLRQVPRSGPLLRVWDGLVVPLTRRLEARRRPPFGQSLLAVGRVDDLTAPSRSRS